MPRIRRKKNKDKNPTESCNTLPQVETKAVSNGSSSQGGGLLSSLSSSIRRSSSASNLLKLAESTNTNSSSPSTLTTEKSSSISFFARFRQSSDDRTLKDTMLDTDNASPEDLMDESPETETLSDYESVSDEQFNLRLNDSDDSERTEIKQNSHLPRPSTGQRTMTVPIISIQNELSEESEPMPPFASSSTTSKFFGMTRSNSRRASTLNNIDSQSVPASPGTQSPNGRSSNNSNSSGGAFNRLKKKTFSRLFSSDIPHMPPASPIAVADGQSKVTGTSSPSTPTPYSPSGYSLPAYGIPQNGGSSLKSSPELDAINEQGNSAEMALKLARTGSITDSLHNLAMSIGRPSSAAGVKSSSSLSLTLPPLVRSMSSQSTRDDVSDKASEPSSPRPRSRTLNSLSQTAMGIGDLHSSESNTSSFHRVERPGSALANLDRPSFGSIFTSRIRSDSGGSNNGTTVHNDGAYGALSPSPRHSAEDDIELPTLLEDETEKDYFERIRTQLGGRTAAALAKTDNTFTMNLLQKYVATYNFVDEPLDMALRKFLMYVRLPKETQQIDRILDVFSHTYYNHNKDIYPSCETVYVIAFSLMILHTDCFNRSNKHKMSKLEYIRNIQAKDVNKEILECLYDNITYTQFIHTDEEPTLSIKQPWAKRPGSFRNAKDLIDPYAILLENRLDVLRPKLDAVLRFTDPYLDGSCKSAAEFMNLRRQVVNCRYLQLVSQRSRPEAFLSPDPERSDPGMVDIKIVKVGVMYRREAKRMLYSKSTWREWGAILTGSQLYLFKDVAWIRRVAASSQTVVRPPPDGFHPTSVLSTTNMIALQPDNFDTSAFSVNVSSVDEIPMGSSAPYHISDSGSRFCFVLGGRVGAQDWFAADSAEDLADWVDKINLTGCFSTYNLSVDASHVQQSGEIVKQRLVELEDRLKTVDESLRHSIRFGKHLRLLAPIQQRTREAVIFAAGRLAAKLDWYYLDRHRLYCYRALFRWEQSCLPDIQREFEEAQARANARAAVQASNIGFMRRESDPSEFVESPLPFTNELNLHSHVNTPPPDDLPPSRGESTLVDSTESSHQHITNYKILRNEVDEAYDEQQSHSRRPSDSSSLAPSLRDIERMHYEGRSGQQQASGREDDGVLSVDDNNEDEDEEKLEISAKLPKRSMQQKKLRALKNESNKKEERQESPQRSASLMRKEQGGFTLHGRKFTVVEVNPEFAASPNFQRSLSKGDTTLEQPKNEQSTCPPE